jgi:serine/threonine-protein kinase HipA
MMTMSRKLTVSTPQGESGDLHKEARYSFRYRTDDRSRELSLTLPIRAEDYASTDLLPPFESCLPEGHIRERLTKRLLKFGKVDDMTLLEAVGGNGIGRLRFSSGEPRSSRPASEPPSLKEILSTRDSGEVFEHLLDTYIASGISGVQPKALVPELIKGTVVQPSVIVKATPPEYPSLAKNEFVCMEVARRAGLDVPPGFWLSDDGQLFVVSRFDIDQREGAAFHLGFEDFCQLMGKTSNGKYEGKYENVVKAIHLFCGGNAAESSRKFFSYLAASVLLENGDAHLKNFGLIYEHPRADKPKIAPLYDVTTTSIYSVAGSKDLTMALKLDGDRRYPSYDALIRFGREKCGVARPAEVIDSIAQSMMDVASEYADLFDRSFRDELFGAWARSLRRYGVDWTPGDGSGPSTRPAASC